MSAKKSLAIYDDAPVFGGHEQMSCCGIRALAAQSDLQITCFISQRNEILRKKLDAISADCGDLKVEELDLWSRRFQGVRSLFDRRSIRRIAERFKLSGADAVVALQGDIELSSLGVLAGRSLGLPTVSYIPVPHTLATMQAKLGRWRDPFNQWLFHRPDAYITISDGMKAMLRERGARQRIEVVLNGFDPSKTERRDRLQSRIELGLPEAKRIVAMVGRIEFKQKRQDLLVECFARHRSRLKDVHLLFVGSGPDVDELRARTKRLQVEDDVTFVQWTDGLSAVYSAVDVLALPSRFEGVPLVMLEAMSMGLPVVASERDGMKEFLPKSWLFPVGNVDAFADTLVRVLNNDYRSELQTNRERALRDFSMPTFEKSFVAACRQLTGV